MTKVASNVASSTYNSYGKFNDLIFGGKIKKITRLEWVYLSLQAVILLFLIFHDWVPLGNLNDIDAVHHLLTTNELIIQTIMNSVPFAVAFFLCCLYAGKAYPLLMRLFLLFYFPILFYGALSAWWIPYFFGTSAEKAAQYEIMFGNTHTILPILNDITPNTIHLIFHLLLLFVVILTIYFIFGIKRPKACERTKKI